MKSLDSKVLKRAKVAVVCFLASVVLMFVCQYMDTAIGLLAGFLSMGSMLGAIIIGIWVLLDYLEVDYHSNY